MNVRSQDVHKEAVRLLEQTRLREDQISSHLQKALAPGYWQALNPSLSVAKNRAFSDIEATPIDSQQRDELISKFAKEGYFQTEPILSDSVTNRLRECIEVIKREDWPPVFAFIYDEFWLVTRGQSLARLLSSILGPGYKQTSYVWTYYVKQVDGAKGWPPHIDSSHKGKRVTVWIPISDATLNNGCIYLIPQHLVPERVANNFLKLKSVNITELKILLQSSRALPARAGAVLCWDYGMIHWGGTCDRAEGPRISIGMAFIGKHTEPIEEEPPLFDGHSTLPTFAQRLHAIGKGVLTYYFREPLMIRYLELAKRLVRDVEKN